MPRRRMFHHFKKLITIDFNFVTFILYVKSESERREKVRVKVVEREREKCQGQEHWAGNAGLWREYIIGDRSSITFLPLRGHFVIEAASDEDQDDAGNRFWKNYNQTLNCFCN